MHLIDTHQHLWNRSQFTLPWITKGMVLDADFGIPEYKKASGGAVSRTVYMEVDVDPAQQWAEAVQVLHVPATPQGYSLQPDFVKGIKLLGENQLSYDLCVRDVDLPEKSKLVLQCPQTQFILDHCGNPDLKKSDLTPWKKDLEEISRHKNVVIKISGFLASAPARDQWKLEQAALIINHCLDWFHPCQMD